MLVEWCILPVLGILLFAGMLGLEELGRRRNKVRYPEAETDPAAAGTVGTGAIEGSVFALLGLILAFQFNSAASRLDARRNLLVKEANAIGTAYLRLDLLAKEDQPALRDLFRNYLETRIATHEAIPNRAALRKYQKQSNDLQGEIWTAVLQACERKAVPSVTMLLVPAMNEMIDTSASRDTAAITHGSWFVFAFMFGVCLLAALVAGRSMALSAKRPLFHMVVFAALTALTVYVILDLEYPSMGLIRIEIGDQPLISLRQSMR